MICKIEGQFYVQKKAALHMSPIKIFLLLILTLYSTFALSETTIIKSLDKSRPFILGVIDEIQSKELSEKRILNIYLSEGYNVNDTIHFRVVYMFDGAPDEDFIHIATANYKLSTLSKHLIYHQ